MAEIEQLIDDSRGVLQPRLGARHFDLRRHPPGPGADRFVRHYWSVEWDQGDAEPFRQAVLPHPAVNVVFTPAYANVYGLVRGVSVQALEGRGWALGVLFRPAGFTPFWPRRIAELTGCVVPVATVFGEAGEAAWEEITAAQDGAARAAVADRLLRRLAPADAPRAELARDLVEEIARDPDLDRVDQVAAQHALSVRALQRLFREQVGAGPKWIIRRYRLLEAAERAGKGEPVSWADLALALGYADQAHLTREFTEMVGFTPGEYARACRDGRPLPR
ncbi:MAG: helix-turn-helix transcriptional regulator [Candidatus Dormibacteraeota bacterium]|nr:helix-turn-helix transcriptional regulator [Candidatus Dormibacteraeota bacterium]